jgi:hypothetical protein
MQFPIQVNMFDESKRNRLSKMLALITESKCQCVTILGKFKYPAM